MPIFRDREFAFILGRTESPVVIVPSVFRGYDHAAMLERVLAELPGATRGFALGLDEATAHVQPFARHFLDRSWETETEPDRLRKDSIRPDDLAELQFTSGTTGEPKGVMHTANTIHAGTLAFSATGGLTSKDSILMPSTLAHQTGFLAGIVLPLAAGMKVV